MELNENKTASGEAIVNVSKTYVDEREQLAKEIISFFAQRNISQWDWVNVKDDVDRLLRCQKIAPVAD